ncbi:DUF397 domain-containing protein [Kitasatospora sp. NPDC048715]|uniref:DUF397 domain-containing protein n=1 Tax=Kitasatospora sp. NPDC048715 TaxID=3364052 RepID=UPI003712FA82
MTAGTSPPPNASHEKSAPPTSCSTARPGGKSSTPVTCRRSTRNGQGGQCIEVADGNPGLTPVRGSKDPGGPTLPFLSPAVRAGEFDAGRGHLSVAARLGAATRGRTPVSRTAARERLPRDVGPSDGRLRLLQ